jgi:hypothetical protein
MCGHQARSDIKHIAISSRQLHQARRYIKLIWRRTRRRRRRRRRRSEDVNVSHHMVAI